MNVRAWVAVILGAQLLAGPARAEPPPEPLAAPAGAPAEALTGPLLEGAEAVLKGQRKRGLERLQHAALLASEDLDVQAAVGTGALTLGDRAMAQRVLRRVPRMAAYLAMAELDGPGGISRAGTVLARHADTKSPDPAALFLASLAFARAGETDRAHQLLDKAVKTAEGPLDVAFAPDPAVMMSRAVLAVAAREGATDEATVRLASALFEAGRRGEAVRLAEKALKVPATRAAGLRILVLVENAAEARRSLARVERILADDARAEDALVAKVVLLVRLGEYDRAERALEALGSVEADDLSAQLERARAELSLAKKRDPALALEAAEAAARADPKNDETIAILVRALLAAGKVGRAEAFALALFKRRPRDVDPFELFAQVSEAKGEPKKVAENRLRSAGFQREHQRLEKAVSAREEVLRAVRDAEGGLGPVALEAVRGEYPTLSLPVDLALARSATPGFARVARERILASCAPVFTRLLDRNRGWDTVTIAVSLYGDSQNLDAFLSGADPTRCQPAGPVRK